MVARPSLVAPNSSSAALTDVDRPGESDQPGQPDDHDHADDMTVWVCRFGPEHAGGFGQHFHRQHQLAWASTGALSAHVDDEAILVPTNRAVWLPSGCRHDVVARHGTTLHCLYVWPEACPITWARPTLVTVSSMLRELLLLLTESDDEAPVSDAAATLLFSLMEPSVTPDRGLPMPRDEQALAVAVDLLDSPHSPSGLEQLAKRHHLGVSTLRRRFLDETGLTFSEWRRQARLEASLGLLADGLTVESVSMRVGYHSANGYIDAFKRHFGTTPARYRAPA